MNYSALFSTYYGLDWISFLLGVAGMILLTNKRPSGFLFSALSVLFAAVVAVMARQYGFLAANAVSVVIATRGFLKWQK
jgi:hypothetical protein